MTGRVALDGYTREWVAYQMVYDGLLSVVQGVDLG